MKIRLASTQWVKIDENVTDVNAFYEKCFHICASFYIVPPQQAVGATNNGEDVSTVHGNILGGRAIPSWMELLELEDKEMDGIPYATLHPIRSCIVAIFTGCNTQATTPVLKLQV